MCDATHYGTTCSLECNINCLNNACNHVNGSCKDGCAFEMFGDFCNETCDEHCLSCCEKNTEKCKSKIVQKEQSFVLTLITFLVLHFLRIKCTVITIITFFSVFDYTTKRFCNVYFNTFHQWLFYYSIVLLNIL